MTAFWRLLILLVHAAAAHLPSVTAADGDVLVVPSFSISDLRAGHRSDELADVLGSTGLLSVTSFDDNEAGASLASARGAGLSGLCRCVSGGSGGSAQLPPLLSVDGSDRSVLSDGVTSRTTLATATAGNVPLPLPAESLSAACGTSTVSSMDALRDMTAEASEAFLSALDRLLASSSESIASERGEGGKTMQPPTLLHSTHGTKFTSVSSIVRSSMNLEHFHVYAKDVSNASRPSTASEDVDSALRLHTDAGLFLSFVPAVSCNDATEKESDDSSFLVSVRGKVRRAVFPKGDSIAIMLGVGAEHWLSTPELLPLRATRHAVRMKAGDSRAWYGMMHLVPQDAIVQQNPPRTFADMRSSMVMTGGKTRRFGDDPQADMATSIGCGLVDGPSSVASVPMPSAQKKTRRRRLEMVADGSACNNVTNFYCWMSCLDIPDADNAVGYLNEGKSLYCLDPAVLSSAGNRLSSAVETCTEKGTPGLAMNSACLGSWQPTARGIPAQTVLMDSSHDKSQEQYCYGATSMYMQGFQWIGTTCVVYLFPSWVLSTSSKFVGACFGTLVAGLALEGVIRGRRAVVMSTPYGWKRLMASTALYGLQLSLGYLVMLVVMTYSGPLFLCVILGLMLGHAAFTARGHLSGDTDPNVPEGCTPCCQNDLENTKRLTRDVCKEVESPCHNSSSSSGETMSDDNCDGTQRPSCCTTEDITGGELENDMRMCQLSDGATEDGTGTPV